MNFEDIILFDKKSLADLFKDIYKTQKKTESNIMEMIMVLQPFIKSSGDAVLIVPIIKEYMEVKIKSDDALVKMAAIVQRAISSTTKVSNESDYGLTDEEKDQLLLQLNKVGEEQKLLDKEQKQIEQPKK